MPQLNTRCISALVTLPVRCSQSKIAGRGQLEASRRAASPDGNMRCVFSIKPPPVMCAIPLIWICVISASTGLT